MAKQKVMKGVSCSNRKGVEYWYARINGEKKYCGKGSKGQEIAIAAKSKEIGKRYENKEVNVGLKVKKAKFKTVQDLANWYMQQPSVQQKKAYKRKIFAAVHLLKYFGKKQVAHIDGDEQERYREHRKVKAASATIDFEIQVLSAMYHMALRRKKINADAMPGEFIKKMEGNPRRIITDEEFERLLEHADADFKDVLICGYESAMRSSEICKLSAGQVHLNIQHFSGGFMDYIDLGIFDTKTGARRTVPVSPRLKEVLQKRIKNLDPDDYVFTNEKGNFTKFLVPKKIKSVCDKAGVPYGDKLLNKKGERIGVVFHCLRHTRTTKWVEMGFSDEIVRRATGHKSLEAYQNYVKLDPNAVMRLVESQKFKSVRDKNGTKSPQILAK